MKAKNLAITIKKFFNLHIRFLSILNAFILCYKHVLKVKVIEW